MRSGVVLVSGASSGIGLATVARLSERGHHVLAGVRDAAGAARAEAAGAHPVRLDVTDAARIAAAAARVEDECESSDRPLLALVNNAGILRTGPWETMEREALRTLFETNVLGAVALTRALLPRLREDRGRIVFTSSLSARFAAPFGGAYAATKAALEALRDSLAVEVRPFGVRVCSVLPGPISTPIWSKQEAQHIDWGAYESARAAVEQGLALSRRRAVGEHRVARAILRAVESSRPPSRIVIRGPLGWGLEMLLLLPLPLREAVLARALRGPSLPGETP